MAGGMLRGEPLARSQSLGTSHGGHRGAGCPHLSSLRGVTHESSAWAQDVGKAGDGGLSQNEVPMLAAHCVLPGLCSSSVLRGVHRGAGFAAGRADRPWSHRPGARGPCPVLAHHGSEGVLPAMGGARARGACMAAPVPVATKGTGRCRPAGAQPVRACEDFWAMTSMHLASQRL